MKIRSSWVFLLILSGCTMCNKTPEALAPDTLEGKTIHATATEATGSFADMANGYTFDTALLKDRTFKTTTTNNTSESQGQYTYTKANDTLGVLKLTDNSELHKGETIEVSLLFTSSKTGTYTVRVLSGPPGEQRGSFELRQQ